MCNLFIVWSDDFNTGITVIDEQHRGLVSLINSFYFHRADNDIDVTPVLAPTVDMFKAYAKINFQTVEKMLRESGYPDLEKYEARHRAILEAIERLERWTRARRDWKLLLRFLRIYWLKQVKGRSHDYIPHLLAYYGEGTRKAGRKR